ncbi:MAG TPA: sulfotransferase [Woeseiaceae bacterium]|nr:sulfotransferase [Woeseiaceae bacterium]
MAGASSTPKPFAIVADLRTGSTLLASSLDEHPQIRCYGELFHSEDLPDNLIGGLDRLGASAEAILERAMQVGGVEACGFKAMTFLPLPAATQWVDAWDRIRELPGLRVIWLTRRDRLAQYASAEVVRHTGLFHPNDDDRIFRPEQRPVIRIDPDEFRSWVRERDAQLRRRRALLRGLPALDLDYETLTGDWERSTTCVQRFLEVDVVPLEQQKKKQERRPLADVIANYAEFQDRLRG